MCRAFVIAYNGKSKGGHIFPKVNEYMPQIMNKTVIHICLK